MRLTERGWLVAGLADVAAGLGLWLRYPGLTAAATAFAVLVVFDLAAVSLIRSVRVRRTVVPLQVPRYARCDGSLTIVHSGQILPVSLDGAEPVGEGSVPIVGAWLRPRRPVEIGYTVPSHTRGLFHVGPTRLRLLGPAGLVQRREAAGGPVVSVRVLPRVLPVQAVPTGARRGHVTGDERAARGGTDLVGLHEYVPGDDLRRLHWASSARTGTLMVREDADPSRAELAVMLDDRADSYGAPAIPAIPAIPATAAAFEDAVDVAAALVAAASAAGHPIRLRTVSGSVDLADPGALVATGRPAPELLAALADVTLVGSSPASSGVLGPGDPDVLAFISGTAADRAGLVLEAGRAVAGVVLLVDPGPAAPAHVSGSVMVLSGWRAEDLLSLWDRIVVGGAST
jgi:uncharacterized protein (DUF58 family)